LNLASRALIPFLVFFAGCTYKSDYVTISKSLKNKTDYQFLIKRYTKYWDCMSRKDFVCAYKYEMPYQRFLHDFKWYKQFNAGNSKNYKIIALSVVPKGEFALVKSKFISADNKVTYVFYDKWYNVNEKWFHKMKVSLLPFGDNED